MIKPQLEANNKKYIKGKKGGAYGGLGGRPKKINPIETPNANGNANENGNVNEYYVSKGFDLLFIEQEFHQCY